MKTALHRLRVNVKSLAAEARILRSEIRKSHTPDEAKNALAAHRATRLKPEARLANLALAFVKGVPYRKVEAKAKTEPSSSQLHGKIQRFTAVRWEVVEDWLETPAARLPEDEV